MVSPLIICPEATITRLMASKKQLIQTVLLQQMPEVQQCCGLRYVLLQEVDPHELAESVTAIDGIFHALVGQMEPALQLVHSQHDFYALWRTPALPLVVERQNNSDPLVSGDDLVHDLQKRIPLCLPFPIAVFVVTQTHLSHVFSTPFSSSIPLFFSTRGIYSVIPYDDAVDGQHSRTSMAASQWTAERRRAGLLTPEERRSAHTRPWQRERFRYITTPHWSNQRRLSRNSVFTTKLKYGFSVSIRIV